VQQLHEQVHDVVVGEIWGKVHCGFIRYTDRSGQLGGGGISN
jgi:hypothetical protein